MGECTYTHTHTHIHQGPLTTISETQASAPATAPDCDKHLSSPPLGTHAGLLPARPDRSHIEHSRQKQAVEPGHTGYQDELGSMQAHLEQAALLLGLHLEAEGDPATCGQRAGKKARALEAAGADVTRGADAGRGAREMAGGPQWQQEAGGGRGADGLAETLQDVLEILDTSGPQRGDDARGHQSLQRQQDEADWGLIPKHRVEELRARHLAAKSPDDVAGELTLNPER